MDTHAGRRPNAHRITRAVRASHLVFNASEHTPNLIHQHSNIVWQEQKWWHSDNCVYGLCGPQLVLSYICSPLQQGGWLQPVPGKGLVCRAVEVIAGIGHHTESQGGDKDFPLTYRMLTHSLSLFRLIDFLVLIISFSCWASQKERQHEGRVWSMLSFRRASSRPCKKKATQACFVGGDSSSIAKLIIKLLQHFGRRFSGCLWGDIFQD